MSKKEEKNVAKYFYSFTHFISIIKLDYGFPYVYKGNYNWYYTNERIASENNLRNIFNV